MKDNNYIEKVLEETAKFLDISDELFNKANAEYKALGDWINEETMKSHSNYKVSVYPQGSLALGTVIKPLSDEDDYDLDFVCELSEINLNAKDLKFKVVKPWLENYKDTALLESKKRCWHVEYKDLPQFHMDVVPAKKPSNEKEQIFITNRNDAGHYIYITSNPVGYRNWFFERCKDSFQLMSESQDNKLLIEKADIEYLKRHKLKTSLQRSIQLLKRHRDIMFNNYSDSTASSDGISKDDKPISIIITTLAAQLYNNDGSIVNTITSFLSNVESYLKENMRGGIYHVDNPSNKNENFADKWRSKPNRQRAFFTWIEQAKEDFDINKLKSMDRINILENIKIKFGENLGLKVIKEIALAEKQAIKEGKICVDTSTGSLSQSGTIIVPPNHHYD